MCIFNFFECLDNMEKLYQVYEEFDFLGMGYGQWCKSRESNECRFVYFYFFLVLDQLCLLSKYVMMWLVVLNFCLDFFL